MSQSLDLILYYGGEVQSEALHFTLELSAVNATGWLQQKPSTGQWHENACLKFKIKDFAHLQSASYLL